MDSICIHCGYSSGNCGCAVAIWYAPGIPWIKKRKAFTPINSKKCYSAKTKKVMPAEQKTPLVQLSIGRKPEWSGINFKKM